MLMKADSGQPPTFAEASEAAERQRGSTTGELANKRLLEIHVYPQLGNVRVSDIEQSQSAMASIFRACRVLA